MDIETIKFIIYIAVGIASLTGIYWRLKSTRPTYDKVDEMICKNAYLKEDGIRLEEKHKSMKEDFAEIKNRLNEISFDLKELLKKK